MRKIVATEKAPAAIGPYSQANIVDNMVFASGQIPIDPATGKLVEGDIKAQTTQVFHNIQAILEEAGTRLENVVKTTCLLDDIKDFAPMNEVYATFFPNGVYPSRSAFEVGALPMGAKLEIEVIAMIK